MPVTRPRATYANVVSTLALVIASSGTAYAAATITSKDIKNDSVKSADLKDGAAVRGQDVLQDTLTGQHINEFTLGKVAEAAHADTAGVSGHQLVYSGDKMLPAGASEVYSVDCPPGKVAISAGSWHAYSDIHVFYAYVTDSDTASAAFWNPSGAARAVGVHAVCVDG